MSERGTYHHGDLRNALLSATVELVRERGARGFSVAEAARRAGVSAGAPYRHFSDRDALLAAVAHRSFSELEARFDVLDAGETLVTCAEQIAMAYLSFAREDPARFEVMFAAGIDKSAHPELLEQTWRVQARLENVLAAFLPAADLRTRAAELWSLAHGVAALTTGGSLAHVIDPANTTRMTAAAASAWARGVPLTDGARPWVKPDL